jgi:hypothetical protein
MAALYTERQVITSPAHRACPSSLLFMTWLEDVDFFKNAEFMPSSLGLFEVARRMLYRSCRVSKIFRTSTKQALQGRLFVAWSLSLFRLLIFDALMRSGNLRGLFTARRLLIFCDFQTSEIVGQFRSVKITRKITDISIHPNSIVPCARHVKRE